MEDCSLSIPLTTSTLTAFFAHIELAQTGCWRWTGPRSPTGYGLLKGVAAHRLAADWFVGPIPPGQHVHHRCGVRHCVNPVHLELLTATAHASETWRERRLSRLVPPSTVLQRPPTHPGAVFEEEYRKPSGISQAEAARRMGMSANRLNEIVAGKRAVTAETAVLFEVETGVAARFWLQLQLDVDLWAAYRAAAGEKRTPSVPGGAPEGVRPTR